VVGLKVRVGATPDKKFVGYFDRDLLAIDGSHEPDTIELSYVRGVLTRRR
jgi:hypothetical protein